VLSYRREIEHYRFAPCAKRATRTVPGELLPPRLIERAIFPPKTAISSAGAVKVPVSSVANYKSRAAEYRYRPGPKHVLRFRLLLRDAPFSGPMPDLLAAGGSRAASKIVISSTSGVSQIQRRETLGRCSD